MGPGAYGLNRGPWFVACSARSQVGDWILVYEDPANHLGTAGYILYVNGAVKFVEEPRHSAELRRFREQYEAARGAPPVIVEQKP